MKVAILTIILALLAMVSVSSAAIITVGKDGYATIQAALNASSDGDTIQIDRGVYSENLFVGKSVSFIGAGEGTVVQPLMWTQPTLFIMASNVSIEGIHLVNGSVAIKSMWSENLSIKNTSFEGNSYGIWLSGSDNGIVKGNIFKENRVHLFFEDAKLTTIHQNQLKGGTIGLSMILSGFNSITDNLIENCEAGFKLRNSGDNLIQGNEFTNCSIGIALMISSGNSIARNRVNAIPTFLDLTATSQNVISENEFEDVDVFAKNFGSEDNNFILSKVNLTGLNFEFSLIKPSLPENYIALSDAINVTIIPDIFTNAGYIYMESNLTEDEVKELASKIDPSTIAFYKLDSSVPEKVSEKISEKASEKVSEKISEGFAQVSFTSKQSGIYVLAGEKAKRIPSFELSLALLAIAYIAYLTARRKKI
jgi:parallel beta-helix repeat protein